MQTRILRALTWCADSPSPLKVVLTVREPAFVTLITLKRPLLLNTSDQRLGAIMVNKDAYSEPEPVSNCGRICFRIQRICSQRISPSNNSDKAISRRTGEIKSAAMNRRIEKSTKSAEIGPGVFRHSSYLNLFP